VKNIKISPVTGFDAVIKVQGDKSISHRAIIIGSLAKGTTRISNFLEASDTLDTAAIYRRMGVGIEKKGRDYFVRGKGLFSLKKPGKMLYAGNSGTSIRLNLGVLAAQPLSPT